MLKINDAVPSVDLFRMGADGPEAVNTAELFAGKKVVLFAVPGAFTPTCSMAHLPGFVVKADEIKAKGVDMVACISVNDVFVMNAWGEQNNAEHLEMLADGLGDFAEAMDMQLDLSARGIGMRSDRYAIIVDNGVITHLAREEPGKLEVSSAEAILQVL